MSDAKPPTKRMLAFLGWAKAQGGFTTWPIEMSAIRRRAEAAGLIERSGKDERGVLGFVGWKLSEKGAQVLAQ